MKLPMAIMIATAMAARAETLTFENPEVAGLSGFRAHWDKAISVAEDGVRVTVDSKVKDRGQTAVWDGVKPGALAFDGQHRSLLVRFPDAAEKIAAAGKEIERAFVDEKGAPTAGKHGFAGEAILHGSRHHERLVARDEHADAHACVERLVDKLWKQLERGKERRKDHRGPSFSGDDPKER